MSAQVDKHSLKTQLKFHQLHYHCATSAQRFPIRLWLPNPRPKFSRKLPSLFAISSLGFLQALRLSYFQLKVCQCLMLLGCSLSPRTLVAKPLTNVQPKVEVHCSLFCTSCLQLPKSLPKSNLSLYPFNTSNDSSILKSLFDCLVFKTCTQRVLKLLVYQIKVQHDKPSVSCLVANHFLDKI